MTPQPASPAPTTYTEGDVDELARDLADVFAEARDGVRLALGLRDQLAERLLRRGWTRRAPAAPAPAPKLLTLAGLTDALVKRQALIRVGDGEHRVTGRLLAVVPVLERLILELDAGGTRIRVGPVHRSVYCEVLD